MYEVTFGSLVKENGNWTIDGMRAAQCETFENLEDAKQKFDNYNVEDDFKTEWATATVKPKKRGFYAELAKVDEDDMMESIEWKQFTADDIFAEWEQAED